MLSPKFYVSAILILLGFTALFGTDFHFNRDPFVPQTGKIITAAYSNNNAPIEEESELIIKLTGIIWDETTPFAMFDTPDGKRIVKETDQIMQWDVTSVSKDKVLLKRNSKTLIVRVGKEVAL